MSPIMIRSLKSLLALLFAVSLLCGTGVSAAGMHSGAPMGPQAMAAMTLVQQSAPAHDCGACDQGREMADMACAAMAAHCASAIAAIGGMTLVERLALPVDRAAQVDLVLIGAGPESDTPPPRG